MPFGLNVLGSYFSWGIADVVLIAFAIYFILSSSIMTKGLHKYTIKYYLFIIYFVQLFSFVIDIAYGNSPIFVIGNLMKYIQPIIFYELITRYFKEDAIELYHILVVICFIANIVGIIQILSPEFYHKFISASVYYEESVDYVETFMYARVASTMLNPGTYAWFLIVTIPIQLYSIAKSSSFWWKIFCSIVMISSIVMLIFTQSRTQWIAIIAMLTFYIIKISKAERTRNTILLLLLLSILFIVIRRLFGEQIFRRLILTNRSGQYTYLGISIGYSLAARLNYMKAASRAILNNILIGAGYCNISNVLGNFVGDMPISDMFKISNPTVHNQYLSLILQTGIPLASVIFYSYYKMIQLINIESRIIKSSIYMIMMFIGIIISGFAGDILYSSRIASMMTIIIATNEIEYRKLVEENEN